MSFGRDTQIELQQWMDSNGAHYLPFFTSLDKLQAAVQDETPYIALQGRDFLNLTRGSRMILNPGSPQSQEFTGADVERLLVNGSTEPVRRRMVAEDTKVRLGQPAEYPHEMVQALGEMFEKEPDVVRAYLAMMHDPARDERPALVVGIETSGNIEEICRKAGAVATDSAPAGQVVDLTPVLPEEGGISAYFRDQTQPFYEKRASGMFGSIFGIGNA